MEDYIFYCYKQWLEDNYGTFKNRLLGLTKPAFILLLLLLIVLIVIVVSLVYSSFNKCFSDWMYIPMGVELVLSVIISIYSERYMLKNSKSDLSKYMKKCRKILDEVIPKSNANLRFVQMLIDRYNAIINGTEEKIKHNHNLIYKFMELLMLPISAAILGALLDKSSNVEEIINFGFSIALIVSLVYGLIIFILFAYDNIMRIPLAKYKQFITDLQSIIDLNLCNDVISSEVNDTSPSSEEAQENNAVSSSTSIV